MGVAYSPPDKVIHADLDASSSHCLRQGLHIAVQKAGWVIDREITNGFVYILISPQDASLQCKVQIQDTGRQIFPFFSPILDVMFMDIEEVNKSPLYALHHTSPSYGAPTRRMRAHITPCQIFTYVPGVTHNANSVMGGIPFIDPNALDSTIDLCADEVNDLKTARAWWSCSDLSTADYDWGVPSFRTSWHAGCSATLHNNTFVIEPRAFPDDSARLRIPVMQRPQHFLESYGNVNSDYPVILRWTGTDQPLCFDPFVAWSDTHPVKIRGQLWDAIYRTQYVSWESPLTFDYLLWFSYSTGERQYNGGAPHLYSTGDIFTLYLRDPGLTHFECDAPEPEPPTESNYAY